VSELRFSFDEMHQEVQHFYAFAKTFLSPTAEACLDAFAGRLDMIRSKAPLANNPSNILNKSYIWVIPEHQPLLTKPSRSYEKGKRRGGTEMIGRLTAIWEITPEPKKSNFDVPKQFRLT
jgi:hypothetical protein